MKAIVELYYSHSCSHCPPAKELVERVCAALETERPGEVELKEYDVNSPEGAARVRGYGIVGTPAVIVKGPALAGGFLLDAINEATLRKAVATASGREGEKEKKKGFWKSLFGG